MSAKKLEGNGINSKHLDVSINPVWCLFTKCKEAIIIVFELKRVFVFRAVYYIFFARERQSSLDCKIIGSHIVGPQNK